MNQMRSGRVSPVPGGRAVLGRPVSVNPPIGHARAGSLVLRGPFASGKLKEDADDDPLKLVRKEIAIYKKLAHRNIVRLYEVLDVPDNDAIFMGK
jgi:serine/threonine protein kinase